MLIFGKTEIKSNRTHHFERALLGWVGVALAFGQRLWKLISKWGMTSSLAWKIKLTQSSWFTDLLYPIRSFQLLQHGRFEILIIQNTFVRKKYTKKEAVKVEKLRFLVIKFAGLFCPLLTKKAWFLKIICPSEICLFTKQFHQIFPQSYSRVTWAHCLLPKV